jgi:putative tricarboxylic transport membrane protein
MNRVDFVVGALFLALGVWLAAASAALPAGMGRLPGPGFFPGIVGGAIALLSALLIATALRGRAGAAFEFENARKLAGAAGLLLLYLLLWDRVPFEIRTAAFLAVLLRVFGERWRSAAAVSLVLTAAVGLAFRYGLRVTFG